MSNPESAQAGPASHDDALYELRRLVALVHDYGSPLTDPSSPELVRYIDQQRAREERDRKRMGSLAALGSVADALPVDVADERVIDEVMAKAHAARVVKPLSRREIDSSRRASIVEERFQPSGEDWEPWRFSHVLPQGRASSEFTTAAPVAVTRNGYGHGLLERRVVEYSPDQSLRLLMLEEEQSRELAATKTELAEARAKVKELDAAVALLLTLNEVLEEASQRGRTSRDARIAELEESVEQLATAAAKAGVRAARADAALVKVKTRVEARLAKAQYCEGSEEDKLLTDVVRIAGKALAPRDDEVLAADEKAGASGTGETKVCPRFGTADHAVNDCVLCLGTGRVPAGEEAKS